jgi:putative nucleotidyltransferase with HDIG domain
MFHFKTLIRQMMAMAMVPYKKRFIPLFSDHYIEPLNHFQSLPKPPLSIGGIRKLDAPLVQPLSTRSLEAKYFRFPVERIIDNSVTDFDLFADVGSHVILYSGNGYKWVRSELAGLIDNGYEHFWIRPEDSSKAAIYEKMAKLPVISRELKPEDRLQNIQDIGATFSKYLFEGEITESTMRKAQELALGVVECVQEDPGCIKAITGLANHDAYTYLHSIRVSAYATAIAVQMGLSKSDALQQIALGGIFHDVGKSSVPMEIINKTGPLLEAEWLLMKSHPTEGIKKIEDSCLHHVSREIVLHHHERLNGSGYPHALTKESLLPEVQIATLADVFDALTSSRSYQNKRNRFEALDFIKHRLLRTDIAVEPFKALIECLVK